MNCRMCAKDIYYFGNTKTIFEHIKKKEKQKQKKEEKEKENLELQL